jgi:YggT family protein
VSGQVANILGQAIGLYQTTIFVYVILSWVQRDGSGPLGSVYRVLGTVCEPFVGVFRRILPSAITGGSGLDFSPLLAILALSLLRRLVLGAF